MGTISLETKQTYAAKTRQSNYVASLRLEGFKTTLADGEKSLPSREEVLKAFSKNSRWAR